MSVDMTGDAPATNPKGGSHDRGIDDHERDDGLLRRRWLRLRRRLLPGRLPTGLLRRLSAADGLAGRSRERPARPFRPLGAALGALRPHPATI